MSADFYTYLDTTRSAVRCTCVLVFMLKGTEWKTSSRTEDLFRRHSRPAWCGFQWVRCFVEWLSDLLVMSGSIFTSPFGPAGPVTPPVGTDEVRWRNEFETATTIAVDGRRRGLEHKQHKKSRTVSFQSLQSSASAVGMFVMVSIRWWSAIDSKETPQPRKSVISTKNFDETGVKYFEETGVKYFEETGVKYFEETERGS